jgi:hypothetical protein
MIIGKRLTLKRAKPPIILQARDRNEMLSKVSSWLKSQGYGIHQTKAWEKPIDFCSRLDISSYTLNRRLKNKACPEVEIERGPSGRLLLLRPTSEFEKFCLGKKKAT